MYTDQLLLEIKLYQLCLWCTKFANSSMKKLKVEQKYAKCREMRDLRIVCDTFLAQVCDEDIAFVERWEMSM